MTFSDKLKDMLDLTNVIFSAISLIIGNSWNLKIETFLYGNFLDVQ